MVPLLSSYSAMTVDFTGTSGSQSYNATESYTTIYASATTYKINITESAEGQPSISSTVWILKDGAVVAADVSGYNITGSEASGMTLGLFAGFIIEIAFGNQLYTYTSPSFFHSTGTSTVTIGASTFTVTKYAANNLPETVNSCGVSETLNTYSLSEGTPSGASYPLVVSLDITGSDSSGSFSYMIQVTSITLG